MHPEWTSYNVRQFCNMFTKTIYKLDIVGDKKVSVTTSNEAREIVIFRVMLRHYWTERWWDQERKLIED